MNLEVVFIRLPVARDSHRIVLFKDFVQGVVSRAKPFP